MPLYQPPAAFPSDLQGELLDFTRSSEVSTMHRQDWTAVSATVTTGNVYGAITRSRTAGVFTKCRFYIGTTFTAVTDLRVGVYDATAATKLGETGNLSGAGSASTLMDNQALAASVTLTQGQVVFLALGFIGSACTIGGCTVAPQVVTTLSPPISKAQSGWTTGVLPSSLGQATSIRPWIELIP